MTPFLLDGPALEPVTLAQIKAHLRLDSDDEDGLLTALIVASRLIVEAQSGRLLLTQTWRLVLDRWPAGPLSLRLAPLQRIAAARLIDAAGEAVPLDPALLRLDARCDPPLIHVDPAVPAPGAPHNGIEIDVVAGFGDTLDAVPAPLIQAVTMLAARWFEQRGDIVDREEPKLPAPIAALIAPYRGVRL